MDAQDTPQQAKTRADEARVLSVFNFPVWRDAGERDRGFYLFQTRARNRSEPKIRCLLYFLTPIATRGWPGLLRLDYYTESGGLQLLVIPMRLHRKLATPFGSKTSLLSDRLTIRISVARHE